MPSFRNKRSGKVITVADRDAHRYRGSNFEPVPDLIGEHEPLSTVYIGVPEGTVAEILAWAGDDPVRRAAALEAEKAGKGRKGLLSSLGG